MQVRQGFRSRNFCVYPKRLKQVKSDLPAAGIYAVSHHRKRRRNRVHITYNGHESGGGHPNSLWRLTRRSFKKKRGVQK
jgi:hypothetical protein